MGTQIDLRDDAATIDKLAKNKQKPLSLEAGEKLAKELRAVKYVECSALTQVIIYLSIFRGVVLRWVGGRGGGGPDLPPPPSFGSYYSKSWFRPLHFFRSKGPKIILSAWALSLLKA